MEYKKERKELSEKWTKIKNIVRNSQEFLWQ